MTSAIQGRLAGLLLVRQEDSNVHGRYIRVGVSYELPSKLLISQGTHGGSRSEESMREIEGGDYQISII